MPLNDSGNAGFHYPINPCEPTISHADNHLLRFAIANSSNVASRFTYFYLLNEGDKFLAVYAFGGCWYVLQYRGWVPKAGWDDCQSPATIDMRARYPVLSPLGLTKTRAKWWVF